MADENLLSPQADRYLAIRKRSEASEFPLCFSTNAFKLSPPSALTVPAIYIDRHSGSRGETTANREFSPMSAVSALC